MNQFIKKTILFILIPFITFIILFLCIGIINRKISSNTYSYIKTPILFAGDSHIEQTINDTISGKFVNIGQISESYYFTYYKLKLLFETNTPVSRVYLGFGYHNISSYFNMFINGKFSNSVLSKYFFILPFNEQIRILYSRKNEILSLIKAILKSGIQNIIYEKKTFQGGFINQFVDTKAIISSMHERIEFQYFENGVLNDYCEQNILYLNKIAELCKANNVKLVFVKTPLHEHYNSLIPQKFIEKYGHLIDEMGIDILDLSDLLAEDDCFFTDGDHVSNKGARITSEWIVNNL